MSDKLLIATLIPTGYQGWWLRSNCSKLQMPLLGSSEEFLTVKYLVSLWSSDTSYPKGIMRMINLNSSWDVLIEIETYLYF